MTQQSRLVFPAGFSWGVATAAYQIEGAVAGDGRGASVWDTFAAVPGKVRDGHAGDLPQVARCEEGSAAGRWRRPQGNGPKVGRAEHGR